jgi:chromosome partitioning protein
MSSQIISIANQKGGVAKTTSSANLAHALMALGAKVLLIDSDPQGSLGIAEGINPEALSQLDRDGATYYYGLVKNAPLEQLILKRAGHPDIIPTTIRLANVEKELTSPYGVHQVLKKKLHGLREEYDFIIIDCPPSIGMLTVNALTASTHVLVPCKTDYLSAMGIPLLLESIEEARVNANPDLKIIGIVPTMFNSRTSHDAAVLEQLRAIGEQNQIRVFEPVYRATAYDRAALEGVPTITAAPDSKGIEVYKLIAKELYEQQKQS